MRTDWYKRARFALRAAATVILCGLLVYFADARELWATLRQADGTKVALGTLCFCGGQFIAAQRWRNILRRRELLLTPLSAFRLNLMGNFVGMFLPGQGSGDLVKSAFLFPRYPQRKALLLASVVLDRLSGLAATVCLAGLAALILGAVVVEARWFRYAGMSLLAGALLMVVAWKTGWASKLFKTGEGHPVWRRIASFSSELWALLRDCSLLINIFLFSLAFQLSWALSLWIMLWALHPDAPLLPVMLVAPLSVLIATLPVSVGGLGVREGAFSLLMQQFGVSAEVATAAALLSMLPILLMAGLGGILLLYWRPLSLLSQSTQRGNMKPRKP